MAAGSSAFEPLALSASALRAVRRAGGRGRLASVFLRSVNVECAGWTVNAGTRSADTVCSMEVRAEDLERLRGLGVDRTVEVVVGDRSRVVALPPPSRGWPPAAAALGLLRVAAHGSWFATEQGRRYGADPLMRAASELARHALSGRVEDPGAAVAGLIGLGQGLTPSGDDAVVAMLAALAASGLGPWPSSSLGRSLAGDRPPTTDVSATALRLALAGEFSADLVGVVESLAADSAAACRERIAALSRHGATSGRDAIAGLCALGDAWEREERQ